MEFRFSHALPIALALASLILFIPSGSYALRLKDVPTLVKDKNTDVRAAKKDEEAAEYSILSARARHFPTLSARGTYIHLGSKGQIAVAPQTFPIGNLASLTLELPPISLDQQDVFLSSLILKMPLFAGGRISAGVSAAKAQHEEASSLHTKALEEKTQEAMTRYTGVQLARAVVGVLKKMQSDLDRVRAISDGLVKSGLGAKFSVLQVKVAQAELRSRLIEAEGKAELADLAFKSSVGYDSITTVEYETPLKKAELPTRVDLYKAQALEKRAEFKILDSKEKQAGALKAVHTGELLPTVALVGAHDIFSVNSAVLEPHWGVGVLIEVPLTSWTSALPERARAVKLEEKVEILRTKAREEIPLQIEKIFVELKSQHGAFLAAEEAHAAAQEASRLAEVRFKNGSGSALETLKASTDLERAEIQRLQLTSQFDLKLMELYQAAGNVNDFIAAYEGSGK